MCVIFSLDGKIRLCLLNAPGTFHDSTMVDYGIYEGMETICNKYRAKVVIESTFKIGTKDFVEKPAQENPTDLEKLIINRSATSVRELNE